jgi:hypothetical protein
MEATPKAKLPRLALSSIAVIIMALGLALGAGLEKAQADELTAGSPALSSTPGADETYPLWVGDTQVTSASTEGQGWKFTPASGDKPATLDLNGYSYTGPGHLETLEDYDGEWEYYRHAPIFWNDNGELVVGLTGENSVVVTADTADGNATEASAGEDDEDPTHRYCGIFCAGSLTIRGTGSLAANAGGIEHGDAGIYAKGDVNIESGSVSATGYDYGIYSYEGTIAIGADAGTVAAETTGGALSLHGISAEYGDVIIDGGTVIAKGYRGISVGGDIVINGGDVSAQCTVPASYTTSIMAPCAIACNYGVLTVNGGTVTAKGHQFGIFAARYPASGEKELVPGITINGGSIVAESRESESSGIGIDGCIMTVKGGSVQAVGTGEKAYGVSANSSRGEPGNGLLVIEGGVESFVAQGPAGAINADTCVKNAVAGFGYSNVAGTEGKAFIDASTQSSDLSSHKRVVFPATATPAKTPTAGKEMVTAGAGGSRLPNAGDEAPYTVPAALMALAAAMLAFSVRTRAVRP